MRKMLKHTITRSYLVRRHETWIVTMPDDMDPDHLIADHPDDFDNDLSNGGSALYGWVAEQVTGDAEAIDYPELKLEVVQKQIANVLPFQRKGEQP